jgi:hypothetical protein
VVVLLRDVDGGEGCLCQQYSFLMGISAFFLLLCFFFSVLHLQSVAFSWAQSCVLSKIHVMFDGTLEMWRLWIASLNTK